MMHVKNRDFIEKLSNIGVKDGDIIYIHSQLFGIGMVEGARNSEELCQNVLQNFLELVGHKGTLVVPTFTTKIARTGQPFNSDSTVCDTGTFSEFVRKQKNSIRSLHPINSVTALGPLSHEICENVAATNYGYETPFHRMLKLNAKAVNVGFANRFSNSWHHHAETSLNLPYLYNKLLDIEVWQGEKKIEGPFYASLRYLDFEISNQMTLFDQKMLKTGAMKKIQLGKSYASCVDARVYFEEAIKLLKQNPWALLTKPPQFRRGEIPWDDAPGH